MSYVDRYSRRDVALILTVFVMNVGDAFFTMLWLDRGGKEANPVMDFFLDIGPWAFLVQKCAVVGVWLVVLLVHKNFRFARIGLYVSLAAYAILMLIHFGIIASGIEPPKDQDIETSRRIHDRGMMPSDQISVRIDVTSEYAAEIGDRALTISRRVGPPTTE